MWPRSAKVPSLWNVTSPPDVRIRVGEPIALAGDDLDEDTTRIMAAISALLPEEARHKRVPTEEELRATLPSSYEGDPWHYGREQDRRPGSD